LRAVRGVGTVARDFFRKYADAGPRHDGPVVALAGGMNNRADGFTLIEVMVAISLLAVGLVSLVQLALLARASDRSAALLTIASVLAQDKMEQLRAEEWPAAASDFCCEFFDAHGALLASGSSPPVGTAYVRRWAIEPVPFIPASACALRVSVAPRGVAPVRLAGVRSRRAG
jgi:prepilin-type N-terminal cleavage/methylation domain-containing protein